ncbi:MAG: ABC transporter ATP-binding protein [Flavobacteriales bacterium]|nr:ABC transporter ATP-binding protein [Flavobacteriales bacterium]
MAAPIITVEHLGKRFQLRHKQHERYTALRDVMAERVKGLFRRSAGETTEEFRALDDVSFTVNAGDRVGIIGRNGAGKSTLLKILSRITPPSSGRVTIDGRVASLLEVGTGFHPELSGRENIFLNGAILGMSRTEIASKFDEIVAFAEVDRFLDTPVKRYSSGMYVRLAFAVAAHLEPEILIVDEVLAVGDAEFQRKCLGKMRSVAGEGRTVLFVSHNMDAVQKLCNTGLLLNKGRLIASGSMEDVVRSYLSARDGSNGRFEVAPPKEEGVPGAIIDVSVSTREGGVSSEVPVLSPFEISVRFRIDRELEHLIAAVGILTQLDMPVRTIWSAPQRIAPGMHEAVFHIDDVMLAAGRFKLTIGLSNHERSFHHAEDAAWFEVLDAARATESRIVNYRSGLVLNQSRVDISALTKPPHEQSRQSNAPAPPEPALRRPAA